MTFKANYMMLTDTNYCKLPIGHSFL